MSATHSPPKTNASLAMPALAAQGPKGLLGRLTTRELAFVIGILASLIALFAPTLARLVAIWNIDPDYSHGFIVLPASLFFAYIAWQRLQERPEPVAVAADARWQGAFAIVLGVLLHWVGLLFDVLIVDVLALVCVLRGALKLVAGKTINDAFAFPAMFLLFMAPLPPMVHQAVAIFMQQAVAAASTLVLETCGVPVFREGYLIHLPRGYLMEVGEACSGLRSMVAIVALAAALGFMTNGPLWYRWTLGFMAFPIAGLANCVRIVLTGVILMNFGTKYAEGMFHSLEGIALIGIAAGLLLALSYVLLQMVAKPATEKEAAT